jgi:hypothetical protein
MSVRLAHLALLLPVAASVACGGAKPRACTSSAACGAGQTCVVGRCGDASGGGAVEPETRRYVLEPESIAFVSSGEDLGRVRPPYVALGADVGDRARILVKFPAATWPSARIARAFLVLERVSGAQAGPGDVTIRAERIIEPWSVRGDVGTTWASPPQSVGMAGAESIVEVRGGAPIRIDVTPYAIELARKGATTWGLRVEGHGDGYGLPVATGFGASGAPPKLEVYVQP